ncbi:hypothetical protein D3C72_2356680 [compost metagenome]
MPISSIFLLMMPDFLRNLTFTMPVRGTLEVLRTWPLTSIFLAMPRMPPTFFLSTPLTTSEPVRGCW